MFESTGNYWLCPKLAEQGKSAKIQVIMHTLEHPSGEASVSRTEDCTGRGDCGIVSDTGTVRWELCAHPRLRKLGS